MTTRVGVKVWRLRQLQIVVGRRSVDIRLPRVQGVQTTYLLLGAEERLMAVRYTVYVYCVSLVAVVCFETIVEDRTLWIPDYQTVAQCTSGCFSSFVRRFHSFRIRRASFSLTHPSGRSPFCHPGSSRLLRFRLGVEVDR